MQVKRIGKCTQNIKLKVHYARSSYILVNFSNKVLNAKICLYFFKVGSGGGNNWGERERKKKEKQTNKGRLLGNC